MLVLALLIGPRQQPPVPVAPPSIAVEMISQERFQELFQSKPPEVVPLATPPEVPAVAPEKAAAPQRGEAVGGNSLPASTSPIKANTFYAESLLAEPASAALRRSMRTLDPDELLVQLCDVEAMAQVRHAHSEYDPDMVVAYARTDMAFHDGTLTADGAAFRSRRQWYEMGFHCTANPERTGVAAFDFTVGDAIPEELWDGYYLTAEESDE